MNTVKVQTEIPGPRSQALIDETLSVISHGQYAGLFGVMLTGGKGMYVSDDDGNTFLDFLGGASVACLGYGRESLIERYAETSRNMNHTCLPYSPNKESMALAKKLIEITPGNHEKKVLFGLTGSDSVDAAIKIAMRYTGKPGILSFKGGYHGSTGFSIGANGFAGIRKGLFLGKNFTMFDFPRTASQADKVLKAIEKVLMKGNTAAFITEVIQGDGGNVAPPDDFHARLADLVKRYGVVHVVDEVQSGIGRSGTWFEIEQYGVVPDILTCGKALGGGYAAISACIARADMAAALGKAQHVYSLAGHPPAAAVALEILNTIEAEKVMENAVARGEQLRAGLQKLVKRYSFCREVRGKGLHMGFEVYDRKQKMPLGGLFAFRCVEKGLYPGYFGMTNEVMRLHPPLVITEKEIDFAIKVISEVAREWANGTFPESTIASYRKFAVGLGSD